MINFDNEDSNGFLNGEYRFMNIKNPFYPTLEQWMQLDSQKYIKDIHESENYNNPKIQDPPRSTSIYTNSTDEQKSLTTDYECLNRSLASLERVSKKKELKNRHDVINKSILRAIKRYLVHVFKTHHVYRRFKERNKKLDYFDTSLTKFVTTYKHLYSTSEMYILFGYLFDAKMFNEVLNRVYKPESKDIAEFTEVFNDCCIHYSHKKFEEIIVNENFIKLYSIFKSNKQLSFLRNHQRVSKNKSEYKLALTEIESKLELL